MMGAHAALDILKEALRRKELEAYGNRHCGTRLGLCLKKTYTLEAQKRVTVRERLVYRTFCLLQIFRFVYKKAQNDIEIEF